MLILKLGYQGAFNYLFVFYCLVAVLSVLAQNTSLMYSVVCVFTLLVSLFALKKQKINKSAVVTFLGLISASGLIFYNRTGSVGAIFPIFFFLYLICFYLYFKSSSVSRVEFLSVLNFSYMAYIMFSVFSYFFMTEYYRAIYLPGFSFRAFHGIEGTPANVDSFSAFVILANFYFNKSKSRFFYYTLAFLVIFFSGALTPILIFIVVILSSLYIKLFKSFSGLMLLFIVAHLLLFYISYNSELMNSLIMVATNGRNLIWDAQIANITSHSLFWSDVAAATVPINWSDGETNNPHNAYLFALFRIGGLCSLLLLLSFFVKSIKATYHGQLLLIAFLAAGISNSNMLYIGNPIYFYMVFFSLFYRGEKNV